MVMKKMKNSIIPLLIVVGLVIFAALAIWQSTTGENFKFVNSNSCNHKFLQWCKDNPRAGDYDNFGNTDEACVGQGSYRTCEQVTEALS